MPRCQMLDDLYYERDIIIISFGELLIFYHMHILCILIMHMIVGSGFGAA